MEMSLLFNSIIKKNGGDAETSRQMTNIYKGDVDMNIVAEKRCTRCGIIKPINEYSQMKSGKCESRCKSCMRERSKQWAKENPEKARARDLKWSSENRDKFLLLKKVWRKSNKEKVKEQKRLWNLAHPEYIASHKLKWQRQNPEKHKISTLKWLNNNIGKIREYNHKRRAMKLKNGGKITEKEWRELKDKYNYTCLCCNRHEPEISLTLDHVKPLYLGGSNIIENAQPLCGTCNSRKGKKHIDYR
jgi:HNH endonuclease